MSFLGGTFSQAFPNFGDVDEAYGWYAENNYYASRSLPRRRERSGPDARPRQRSGSADSGAFAAVGFAASVRPCPDSSLSGRAPTSHPGPTFRSRYAIGHRQ